MLCMITKFPTAFNRKCLHKDFIYKGLFENNKVNMYLGNVFSMSYKHNST